MFIRIDRLQAELPAPKKADPNAAAALQELIGGRYGVMSTLGNSIFQSFDVRSKSKLKPFYNLVSSISTEELGHLERIRLCDVQGHRAAPARPHGRSFFGL